MDYEQALKELNSMKVETGSFVCLGCGHENGCSVHGCAIIRNVVELMEEREHTLLASEAARADLGKRLAAAEQELQDANAEMAKFPEGACKAEKGR